MAQHLQVGFAMRRDECSQARAPALSLDASVKCCIMRAQARERYEEDAAVLRALRMGLRDVTLRLLGDRRWRLFREPGGGWRVEQGTGHRAQVMS